MPTAAYVEQGAKKAFACALDWPGWARAAKTEDEALAALAAYAERYAARRIAWHALDHAWEMQDRSD
ncbi:MAG: hypothetical protein ACRD0S_05980 [Acidimicrobiales bacterium]